MQIEPKFWMAEQWFMEEEWTQLLSVMNYQPEK